MVKADKDVGLVVDWGIRTGMTNVYGILADMIEAKVNAWCLKWSAYINFTVNPVLSLEVPIEALKNFVKAMPKIDQ